jgi:hypothetical protein
MNYKHQTKLPWHIFKKGGIAEDISIMPVSLQTEGFPDKLWVLLGLTNA